MTQMSGEVRLTAGLPSSSDVPQPAKTAHEGTEMYWRAYLQGKGGQSGRNCHKMPQNATASCRKQGIIGSCQGGPHKSKEVQWLLARDESAGLPLSSSLENLFQLSHRCSSSSLIQLALPIIGESLIFCQCCTPTLLFIWRIPELFSFSRNSGVLG